MTPKLSTQGATSRPLTAKNSPPRFAITPVKVASHPTLSMVSPCANNFSNSNNAQAGPSTLGWVIRQPAVSEDEPKSTLARLSPARRITMARRSTPEPHLSVVMGKAMSVSVGKAELERGLDRVFAKHDQAMIRADGVNTVIFRRQKSSRHHCNPHSPSAQENTMEERISGIVPVATPRTMCQSPALFHRVLEKVCDDGISDVFTDIRTPCMAQSEVQSRYIHFDTFDDYDRLSTFSDGYSTLGTGTFLTDRASPTSFNKVIPPASLDKGQTDDQAAKDNETCARIDDLSARICDMVRQGQEALHAPVPEAIAEEASGSTEADQDVLRKWELRLNDDDASWRLGSAAEQVVTGQGSSVGKKRMRKQQVMGRVHRKAASAQVEGREKATRMVRSRSFQLLMHGGIDVL
ncbi:hypothetical protein L204_103001 [Cryptococcus depauperatus]|nr:hypothetical protein L204_00255 [Cryptococcus depauperatus CBS 7855]